MLKSTGLAAELHELERQEIEVRERILGMPELRADEEGYSANAESYRTATRQHLDLSKQVHTKKGELREATDKEAQDTQAALESNPDTSDWTPELRAFRDLYQATDPGQYVLFAANGREIREGPEFEYNTHVLGNFSVGDIPLEQFADRTKPLDPLGMGQIRTPVNEMEKRTEITGPDASHGTPEWMARLFANTEGAYLNASYRSVGPGRHSYPIVTGTGRLGTSRARGASGTAAGGLTIQDADPGRIDANFEYASVDELAMPGIANYLGSDLFGALVAGLDNKVVDDLIDGLTVATATATTITLPTFLGVWASVVDGRGARYMDEVDWLLGSVPESAMTNDIYSKMMPLALASTVPGIPQLFMSQRVRGSAHIKATTGADVSQGIAIRRGVNLPRLIVPVWRRAQLLRSMAHDDQRSGTILLTGVMFADVIVVNEDEHFAYNFDTA